jgi:hypothetical protein
MIPWYVKIPAKVVLSRLPVSGKAWQRLHLFRAGGMDSDQYARSIFDKHFGATGFSDLANKTVLKIGPGESDFMAKSGFYTNRIPWAKMEALLQEHFTVSIRRRNCWHSLPTAQEKMSQPFSAMPAEDLMTLDCHAVLTRRSPIQEHGVK